MLLELMMIDNYQQKFDLRNKKEKTKRFNLGKSKSRKYLMSSQQ